MSKGALAGTQKWGSALVGTQCHSFPAAVSPVASGCVHMCRHIGKCSRHHRPTFRHRLAPCLAQASKDDGCAECSGAECTKCYSGLGFTEPVGPTKSCLNSGGGSDVPQTGEGTDTPPTGEGAEGNITSPTGESTDMPPTGGEGTGTPPIDGQGTDGEGTGTPPTNGEGTGMPLNVEGGDTPPPGEGTGDPPLPDDVGDTLPPLGEGSDTPSSTESTSGDGTGTPSTGGGTGGTPPPGEGTDTPPTVTSTPTEVLPSLLFIGVNITATAENGIGTSERGGAVREQWGASQELRNLLPALPAQGLHLPAIPPCDIMPLPPTHRILQMLRWRRTALPMPSTTRSVVAQHTPGAAAAVKDDL